MSGWTGKWHFIYWWKTWMPKAKRHEARFGATDLTTGRTVALNARREHGSNVTSSLESGSDKKSFKVWWHGLEGTILDDHFHLNRDGRFLDATELPKGWWNRPSIGSLFDFASPPVTRQVIPDTYADTIAMAQEVRDLGLGVRVILGHILLHLLINLSRLGIGLKRIIGIA